MVAGRSGPGQMGLIRRRSPEQRVLGLVAPGARRSRSLHRLSPFRVPFLEMAEDAVAGHVVGAAARGQLQAQVPQKGLLPSMTRSSFVTRACSSAARSGPSLAALIGIAADERFDEFTGEGR